MANNLNIVESVEQQKERINYNENKERVASQTLTVPFTTTVSGGRALIAEHQYGQLIGIGEPEPPTIGTGHENNFGDEGASIIQAESNYVVLDKISKFSAYPNHHYYLIIQREDGVIDMLERRCYQHTTESFGHLYNTDYMDGLEIHSTIHKGDIVRRSNSYDQYLNRQDGRNVLTGYICDDRNTEDSMIMADYVRKQFWSPLVHYIPIIKNENDIFLNWYGHDGLYKCIPDIGEYIKDGIVLASRKSVINEAPYMQYSKQLSNIMMSDRKFTIQGKAKLVDINVFCNNTANISTEYYDSQLYYYYQESVNFINNFIDTVSQYEGRFEFTRELKDTLYRFKRIQRGDIFTKDKEFSNMLIELVLVEENEVSPGDKFADRFGGKGVISTILPDDEMPMLEDGRILGLIKNPKGVNNRENGGQLYELSTNAASEKLLNMISEMLSDGVYDIDEAFDTVLNYINEINHETAEYIKDQFRCNKIDENIIRDHKLEYLDSMIIKGKIPVRLKPITDTVTIDDLDRIISSTGLDNQSYVYTNIKDSNGNVRKVKSRRKITCGNVYTYRLKQYGEEKFSVTAMSSTNLKNENSRSKANSNYTAVHSATPIKWGDMEATDLFHTSAEVVIVNLMILSLSPHGRRMVESMLTDDPFDIDIRLDSSAKNRSVEIINAYLKAIGLKFKFTKKAKQTRPGIIQYEINKFRPSLETPIGIIDEKIYQKRQEEYADKCIENGQLRPGIIMEK